METASSDNSNSSRALTPTPRVAVVGGGVSGLAAAASLVHKGFDVVLLEAADYFGGRVKQAQPFTGFPPVDLGGEFIHGSNTVINRIAADNGWQVNAEKEVLVFLDGKLHPLQSDHPDIASGLTAFNALIESDTHHTSDYVFEVLRDQGLSDVALRLVEILDAQSRASSVAYFGLAERRQKAKCAKEWGQGNYRLEGSYSLLISYYLDKCKKVDKRLDWQVKHIHWTGKDAPRGNKTQTPYPVLLINQHRETVYADYAVITVPLVILKDGDITFSPPLPLAKQLAVERIRVGSALKITCRFKTRFWREDTSSLIDIDGFITQIWMYSRGPRPDGEECHVVVGFQTADRAARKIHLFDDVVCRKFLEQLDRIYGTPDDPCPASLNIINYIYDHWSKHPYVRGGYSASTAHAHGLRHHLASPVSGRLFFAGEATNVKVSGAIHSAIETGTRAAEEVCQSSRRHVREREHIPSKM